IEKAREIRKEGNELFLISNDILYRFRQSGEFVCRITDPEEISVAGYVVNPANRELIVLGNRDDIFYYTFDGQLKQKKKLKSDFSNYQVKSLSMVGELIYTIEERATLVADTQEVIIEQQLVAYDSHFREVESRRLQAVDVGRNRVMPNRQHPHLYQNKQSGLVTAYAPSTDHDQLLRDTLYVYGSYRQQEADAARGMSSLLCPFVTGSRFWLSWHYSEGEDAADYVYYYDTHYHSYHVAQGGLRDDYYKTGMVSHLAPMDLEGRLFSYCKSGEEVRSAFPDHHSGNAVVFIVQLKEA
ncbi:6-bladed beta-propeller, partial [Parabacteroides sp. OttesenSCG-928-N08]|nr:6-bladed beta-propeller [Parabacteroides sp. OttesenSCG-928-N08]